MSLFPPRKPVDEETGNDKLPFMSHLEELRGRLMKSVGALLVAFGLCYWKSQIFFDFFMQPLVKALPEGSTIVMLRVTEGFMAHIKVSLAAAVLFACPVIFYQLWRFIEPALKAREKRFVFPFVGGATVFFLMGVSFAHFAVFPVGLKYLLDYARGNPFMTATISVDWYFGFAMKMLLAFGIVFELPVIVFFLAKIGLVNHRMLSRARGLAVIIIFVVAAVLTPSPDAFSQILMAVPLLILYELSILVARIVGPKPSPEVAETDEDEEDA
jgi:sec-independent protein translocase protein TatC